MLRAYRHDRVLSIGIWHSHYWIYSLKAARLASNVRVGRGVFPAPPELAPPGEAPD